MANITVADFLKEKADNFRAFLSANSPDAELLKQMKTYQPALLLPTIANLLLPLNTAGQLHVAVTDIMTHLSPADPETTRDKIRRYLECFCDAVSTSSEQEAQ